MKYMVYHKYTDMKNQTGQGPSFVMNILTWNSLVQIQIYTYMKEQSGGGTWFEQALCDASVFCFNQIIRIMDVKYKGRSSGFLPALQLKSIEIVLV